MARVTVEDCLEHVANRFELVMVATKRARQIAVRGDQPMVEWEMDTSTCSRDEIKFFTKLVLPPPEGAATIYKFPE